MTDLQNYPILSVCATVASKLSSLPITDGQLIFVQDKHRIALDYNAKRIFYNEIEELDSELVRKSMLAPVSGRFYFVIETAVFWRYGDTGWQQLTAPPDDIVFIGTELPELGSRKTLYADTDKKQISVWMEETGSYEVVADKTMDIEDDDITALFA